MANGFYTTTPISQKVLITFITGQHWLLEKPQVYINVHILYVIVSIATTETYVVGPLHKYISSIYKPNNTYD